MRFPRPSSLNSLMLTGFALVSIPLLLGVVIAATKVRNLSDESATLVRSGVEATHYTQQLFQQIAPIERSARFYQLLNDPDLLGVYPESRERLLQPHSVLIQARGRSGALLDVRGVLLRHRV